MPNSTELRLVIQTSTVNRAQAARLPRFGAALRSFRAGSVAALSTVTGRSRTSALASRAASAAAASASMAAMAADLLPSAILLSPSPRRRERGTEGANRVYRSLAFLGRSKRPAGLERCETGALAQHLRI